jgi:hypothetical protein
MENRETETLAQIFADEGRPKIGMHWGKKYARAAHTIEAGAQNASDRDQVGASKRS